VEVKQITVTVNGEPRIVEVEPRILCVHMIREILGLTGTHLGCDTTGCGACTVLLDGLPSSPPSRAWAGRASCTPSRKASRRSTACSAGSALPA